MPSVGFLPKEPPTSGLLVSPVKTLTGEGGIRNRNRTVSIGGGGAIAMSGTGPISQDWEPIVLRKKAPTAAAKKDEKAVNAARRSGAEIDTIKKRILSLRIHFLLISSEITLSILYLFRRQCWNEQGFFK